LVSTTAVSDRFEICLFVLGILTLLITLSSPQSALIRRIPSSPEGLISTCSSPLASLLLLSKRSPRSSFLQSTGVNPNFHDFTSSGF
jgi:hypothetical protein